MSTEESDDKGNDEGLLLPLWDHLAELRSALLSVLAIIGVAIVICFIFCDSLLSFLESPMQAASSKQGLHEERLEYMRIHNTYKIPQIVNTPSNASPLPHDSSLITQTAPQTYLLQPGAALIYSKPIASTRLVLLGPLEGMLVAFKTSFWVGIVGSSPLWLLILMRFIFPALHQHEKRLALPFILTSLGLVTTGFMFAFYITIPLANQWLISFNQNIGINLWSLEKYLDYTWFLLLANGFAFELGAVGILAVRLGLISSEWLVAHRRPAILTAFILATLLTPPDVLTQLLLAFPLIGLYEGLIIYARIKERLQRTHSQQERV